MTGPARMERGIAGRVPSWAILLLLPCLAWSGFATQLNFLIWQLNLKP